MALHDIVPGAESLVGGVPRYWQELKTELDVDEIVEEWTQGGFGIGLIRTRGGTGTTLSWPPRDSASPASE